MKTEKQIPLSPFHCPLQFRRLSRPEFDEMSRVVMAHVFASQNEGYETQLRRFLALTPLTTLHWVNLHHHELQLVTITR